VRFENCFTLEMRRLSTHNAAEDRDCERQEMQKVRNGGEVRGNWWLAFHVIKRSDGRGLRQRKNDEKCSM
jgi:hypothetical protein